MKQGLLLRDRLLRTKPVEALVAETAGDPKHGHLARSFGLFQLTMLGVGATIGTGIFIIMNEAVPVAGPGLVLSFVIAGMSWENGEVLVTGCSSRSAAVRALLGGGSTRIVRSSPVPVIVPQGAAAESRRPERQVAGRPELSLERP